MNIHEPTIMPNVLEKSEIENRQEKRSMRGLKTISFQINFLISTQQKINEFQVLQIFN